jgi:LysM repeat protein
MTISANTVARVAVLLTTVALVVVLLLANAVSARAPEAPAAFETHRVESGDTLWDIAAHHTAPGDDVRNTVFDIKRANDLADSVIVPGQVLRIPEAG